jgi:DNA invertase Pin-like site-specific DNA recombinase
MPKHYAQTGGLVDGAAPKAYSYIRMSTPEQLKGDSLRRQMARTRRYVEEHNLDLIESFDDLGVSGFRGKNGELGALARFKDLVEQGEIEKGSYLIVESMDRLSRQNVMDAFLQLAAIVRAGITLVTLDDRQVYSKQTIESENIKLYIALGAMARAHEESRRKSDLLAHTWIGKRQLLRDFGVVLTRQVPAWLQADRIKNEVSVVPERADIVREIFTLTRDGYGTYSLSQRLNKRGIKPWSKRKNAVWRESYIKKILMSRAVLGEFQPHTQHVDQNRRRVLIPDGDVIFDYYPPVISHQLFQEAAQAVDARRRKGKGRKGKKYANLFTGLLRCHCSAGMRYVDKGAPPKGGKYLRCSVALAGGGCKARSFRYPVIESKLLHALEVLDVGKILGGPSRKQKLVEIEHRRSMLQVDLDGVETKIRRVIEAIESISDFKLESLTDELRKLERLKGSLRLEIDSLDLEANELLTISPEDRKVVITGLLRQIAAVEDPDDMERTRRALASEVMRLIDTITIKPMPYFPHEVIGDDRDWRRTFGISTEKELEDLLQLNGYAISIKYRNGDYQLLEGLRANGLKFRESKQMKKLKLSVAESKLAE